MENQSQQNKINTDDIYYSKRDVSSNTEWSENSSSRRCQIYRVTYESQTKVKKDIIKRKLGIQLGKYIHITTLDWKQLVIHLLRPGEQGPFTLCVCGARISSARHVHLKRDSWTRGGSPRTGKTLENVRFCYMRNTNSGYEMGTAINCYIYY